MAGDSSHTGTTGLEIAVVGMAGRFPGARDLEAFWRNLRDGVESITFLKDGSLLRAGWFSHTRAISGGRVFDGDAADIFLMRLAP